MFFFFLFFSGTPSSRYSPPIGWVRIGLRTNDDDQLLFPKWHVAYHGTTSSNVVGIVKDRTLKVPDNKTVFIREGHIPDQFYFFTTPSILYSSFGLYASPFEMAGGWWQIVVQLLQQPGTYQKTVETSGLGSASLDPCFPNAEVEWKSNKHKTSAAYGVLLRRIPNKEPSSYPPGTYFKLDGGLWFQPFDGQPPFKPNSTAMRAVPPQGPLSKVLQHIQQPANVIHARLSSLYAESDASTVASKNDLSFNNGLLMQQQQHNHQTPPLSRASSSGGGMDIESGPGLGYHDEAQQQSSSNDSEQHHSTLDSRDNNNNSDSNINNRSTSLDDGESKFTTTKIASTKALSTAQSTNSTTTVPIGGVKNGNALPFSVACKKLSSSPATLSSNPATISVISSSVLVIGGEPNEHQSQSNSKSYHSLPHHNHQHSFMSLPPHLHFHAGASSSYPPRAGILANEPFRSALQRVHHPPPPSVPSLSFAQRPIYASQRECTKQDKYMHAANDDVSSSQCYHANQSLFVLNHHHHHHAFKNSSTAVREEESDHRHVFKERGFPASTSLFTTFSSANHQHQDQYNRNGECSFRDGGMECDTNLVSPISVLGTATADGFLVSEIHTSEKFLFNVAKSCSLPSTQTTTTTTTTSGRESPTTQFSSETEKKKKKDGDDSRSGREGIFLSFPFIKGVVSTETFSTSNSDPNKIKESICIGADTSEITSDPSAARGHLKVLVGGGRCSLTDAKKGSSLYSSSNSKKQHSIASCIKVCESFNLSEGDRTVRNACAHHHHNHHCPNCCCHSSLTTRSKCSSCVKNIKSDCCHSDNFVLLSCHKNHTACINLPDSNFDKNRQIKGTLQENENAIKHCSLCQYHIVDHLIDEKEFPHCIEYKHKQQPDHHLLTDARDDSTSVFSEPSSFIVCHEGYDLPCNQSIRLANDKHQSHHHICKCNDPFHTSSKLMKSSSQNPNILVSVQNLEGHNYVECPNRRLFAGWSSATPYLSQLNRNEKNMTTHNSSDGNINNLNSNPAKRQQQQVKKSENAKCRIKHCCRRRSNSPSSSTCSTVNKDGEKKKKEIMKIDNCSLISSSHFPSSETYLLSNSSDSQKNVDDSFHQDHNQVLYHHCSCSKKDITDNIVYCINVTNLYKCTACMNKEHVKFDSCDQSSRYERAPKMDSHDDGCPLNLPLIGCCCCDYHHQSLLSTSLTCHGEIEIQTDKEVDIDTTHRSKTPVNRTHFQTSTSPHQRKGISSTSICGETFICSCSLSSSMPDDQSVQFSNPQTNYLSSCHHPNNNNTDNPKESLLSTSQTNLHHHRHLTIHQSGKSQFLQHPPPPPLPFSVDQNDKNYCHNLQMRKKDFSLYSNSLHSPSFSCSHHTISPPLGLNKVTTSSTTAASDPKSLAHVQAVEKSNNYFLPTTSLTDCIKIQKKREDLFESHCIKSNKKDKTELCNYSCCCLPSMAKSPCEKIFIHCLSPKTVSSLSPVKSATEDKFSCTHKLTGKFRDGVEYKDNCLSLQQQQQHFYSHDRPASCCCFCCCLNHSQSLFPIPQIQYPYYPSYCSAPFCNNADMTKCNISYNAKDCIPTMIATSDNHARTSHSMTKIPHAFPQAPPNPTAPSTLPSPSCSFSESSSVSVCCSPNQMSEYSLRPNEEEDQEFIGGRERQIENGISTVEKMAFSSFSCVIPIGSKNRTVDRSTEGGI